jgi:hypothetical protein
MAIRPYGVGPYGVGNYSTAPHAIHEVGCNTGVRFDLSGVPQAIRNRGFTAAIVFSLAGTTKLTFPPIPICTAGSAWKKVA